MTREELVEAIKPLKTEVQLAIMSDYDSLMTIGEHWRDEYNNLIHADKIDKMRELLERHFNGTQQVSDKDALLADIMKSVPWLIG